MHNVEKMFNAFPRNIQVDIIELSECGAACFDCSQLCTACADACLGEKEIAKLVQCIRLALDCADIAAATGRLLMRQVGQDWKIARTQISVCENVCRQCAELCEMHASGLKHCKICSDACYRCEDACRRLLHVLPAAA